MAKSSLHPLAADALRFLGRVGIKAAATGFGSVLEDVDSAAAEVRRRTKKARARLAKMIAFDEGQDDEVVYDLEGEE